MSLQGFEQSQFSYEGKTCPVFRRGNGPGVVIIHEIPGITPQVECFANIVADSGFSVVMPNLFGTPGKKISAGYLGEQFLRACISKEFSVLAAGEASPITDYLRALCRHTNQQLGGSGVGVVGMCLTGNFALSLFADDSVMAPVLSQPSLPFGITKKQRSGLHINQADLGRVKQRVAQGEKVMGLRFSADTMCPGVRFKKLKEELGDGFEGIEIDSGFGNDYGIKPLAHSVLTTDLVNEEGHPTYDALQRVLGFFHEKLDGVKEQVV
ncbi:MAG: dienelactone hydrolase family protein [Pseudomonadales bacterium]|nr:dienelactone hydrolase family protein [Pseudomonadales bacterium]